MSKYNYIKWFDEISKDNVGIVGGKGANLGELTKSKLPVPPGFCVTAQAYLKFIDYAGLDEVVRLLMESLDETEFARFAAGSVFIAVPIVLLYFLLIKNMVKGLTAGAVK